MGYGEYNASDFNQREADRGFKIAYQGVARIVSEGDQLARGVSPSEIAAADACRRNYRNGNRFSA